MAVERWCKRWNCRGVNEKLIPHPISRNKYQSQPYSKSRLLITTQSLHMKNIFSILFFTSLIIQLSCEKQENKIYYEGGTSPNLTASRVGTIPLSFANQGQEAIKLSWTNPDYTFTTGLSSQDVSYLLEIDTTGSNFTSPKRQQISLSKDLTRSFTVAELNDILLNQLQLDSLTTHTLEFRVRSTVAGMLPLFSNVLKFSGVKPYAITPKV